GLMAKLPSAPYAAGRRGSAWIKIKTARTLDLVVLAVEWGSGRRKGWLSNLYLGARAPTTGGFVMLGTTVKGMTDEILASQTRDLRVPTQPPRAAPPPPKPASIAGCSERAAHLRRSSPPQ